MEDRDISKKEMPNKRRFTDRISVRRALQARLLHYPKMTSYKALREAVRAGQL